MTLEETRQLGIEFERRVQTMIPQKEIAEKLDSETIFSFLNQYQDKYIHDIYRGLDNIPVGSKLSAHVESVLQALLREEDISIDAEGVINNTSSVTDPNGVTIADSGRSVVYPLSTQFYLYIRSVSNVSSTFSFKSSTTSGNNKSIRVIPNELVSQNDVWKLIETPHDSLRILRRPAAVLSKYNGKKPTLTVIYDQYTTPLGVKVMYYAEPAHFDVMTSTACELPMDVFDDLVTGAVDLYVQYVSGAEANRRRQQEEARRQNERQ
jgi:hypothetical protein